jgi:hypothetical protein
MPDLAAVGIDLETLRRMYTEWCGGAKRSDCRPRASLPEQAGEPRQAVQHAGP